MTFLNPAILLGLFAASIPLIIHLLNLRRLKKIEFSSVAFLKELQQNKIRKLKLKQLLLLIIRTLIIILLVLAFARPTVKNFELGIAPAAKTTSVFILDNSYSMTKVTTTGSYLNQAKKIIRSMINKSNNGDDFALITSPAGNNGEPVLRTAKELLTRQINEINFAYSPGNYASSIEKASGLISKSKNFNKEIYLFSDFQDNNFLIPGNTDTSAINDKNTIIYSFDFSDGIPENLALTSLKTENQILERGKPVSFTAEVKNENDRDIKNSVISLFVNGTRVSQTSFDIKAEKEKKIEFETVINETGFVKIFAELEDDDFPQDNRRYVSLFLPEFVPVCLLYEKQQDAGFVKAALTNDIIKNSIKLTESGIAQSGTIDFDKFDVMIIVGSGGVSIMTRLKEYLKNGGNLILFPAEDSDPVEYSSFIRELNLADAVIPRGRKSGYSNPSEFDKTDLDHPLFKNMFEKKKLNPGSPEFYYYFEYKLNPDARKIISLLNNIPFLSEIKKGGSKIFLFNTSPALTWSNMPVKAVFAPLITKSVFYLSTRIKNEDDLTVGDEIPVNLSKVNSPVLKIISPDGTEEFLNTDSLRNGNYIKYSKTGQPGIYSVFSENKQIDNFALNTDITESSNKFLGDNDLGTLLKKMNFKGKYFPIGNNDNYEKEIYQSRFGTELWQMFLLAALILALVEMYISKSSKKDLAEMES